VLLYRPVGLEEMRLIVEADLTAFPSRRPEQPIFYPVLNRDYAAEIARDWNTRDASSGFAGYVTRFEMPDDYVAGFERHVVGARRHEELWVPADELATFNAQLRPPISVTDAFFGPRFRGHVPDRFNLATKDAAEQFVTLTLLREDNPMDFVCEIAANRAAVYLHYPFWRARAFSVPEVSATVREEVLAHLEESWAGSMPNLPLPQPRRSD